MGKSLGASTSEYTDQCFADFKNYSPSIYLFDQAVVNKFLVISYSGPTETDRPFQMYLADGREAKYVQKDAVWGWQVFPGTSENLLFPTTGKHFELTGKAKGSTAALRSSGFPK